LPGVIWHDVAVDRFLLAMDGSTPTPDRPTIEKLLHDGTLLWLDVVGVDDDVLALLREVFDLHPVAVEDVAEFGQRPKCENYGDVSHLVSYGAQAIGEPLVEVHCFYSAQFLITLRRDEFAALTQLRTHLTSPDGQLPNGHRPARLILLHHVLDRLIDSFFPVLTDFDDKIDDLQEEIFKKPSNEQLSELFSLQRWLVTARKAVAPERDVLASLSSGVTSLPGMSSARMPYVRDLYDHLIRISDFIDSYRDLLSNAMDVYLSTVSNRLNQVMKQLTIIATVFLPLSFLTGFFGQNFGWMISRIGSLGAFLALGLGTEALAVIGLFILFQRRGWMGGG
jgi:magnesium transporter